MLSPAYSGSMPPSVNLPTGSESGSPRRGRLMEKTGFSTVPLETRASNSGGRWLKYVCRETAVMLKPMRPAKLAPWNSFLTAAYMRPACGQS